MWQEMKIDGSSVVITRNRRTETHSFASERDALARFRVVSEALSWIGTPFRDCADTRGPKGGVDCAMLLVRAYVDSGRLAPFDPRPYSNQWHLHQDKEEFLAWIEEKLRGRRIPTPRVGDCIVYQWGRCYAHGAIMINKDEIVHAFKPSELCHVSMMSETLLNFVKGGRPRPRLYFEVV